MGAWELAVADFTRAIELDPEDARPWLNRGSARDSLGELDPAVADFTRAVELDPGYVKAYASRGSACAELGLADRARADFDRARSLATDPGEIDRIREMRQAAGLGD
jgi:Flp pilus assembly protein TadD